MGKNLKMMVLKNMILKGNSLKLFLILLTKKKDLYESPTSFNQLNKRSKKYQSKFIQLSDQVFLIQFSKAR